MQRGRTFKDWVVGAAMAGAATVVVVGVAAELQAGWEHWGRAAEANAAAKAAAAVSGRARAAGGWSTRNRGVPDEERWMGDGRFSGCGGWRAGGSSLDDAATQAFCRLATQDGRGEGSPGACLGPVLLGSSAR